MSSAIDNEDIDGIEIRAIEMGAMRLQPNYSKGSEAGWGLQVYDVASVMLSCSVAGSPISPRLKTIKQTTHPIPGVRTFWSRSWTAVSDISRQRRSSSA